MGKFLFFIIQYFALTCFHILSCIFLKSCNILLKIKYTLEKDWLNLKIIDNYLYLFIHKL